ncbi:MAG: hypothetical protein ACI4TB_02995 [Lachnospiraceae bacterium]
MKSGKTVALLFLLLGIACSGCSFDSAGKTDQTETQIESTVDESREEAGGQNAADAIAEGDDGSGAGEETNEELTEERIFIQVFEQEDVGVISEAGEYGFVAAIPEVAEYEFADAYELGEVEEMHGWLPGTGEGVWYTIVIDGIEYYYGKYDFKEDAEPSLFGYSIISDAYELANGISVGMTKEEILEKYPNMAVMDFEGNYLYEEVTGHQGWNSAAYPGGFETRFDYIMIADIDLGTYDTLPIYVGLLMKKDTVSAITFYYPTAN